MYVVVRRHGDKRFHHRCDTRTGGTNRTVVGIVQSFTRPLDIRSTQSTYAFYHDVLRDRIHNYPCGSTTLRTRRSLSTITGTSRPSTWVPRLQKSHRQLHRHHRTRNETTTKCRPTNNYKSTHCSQRMFANENNTSHRLRPLLVRIVELTAPGTSKHNEPRGDTSTTIYTPSIGFPIRIPGNPRATPRTISILVGTVDRSTVGLGLLPNTGTIHSVVSGAFNTTN